MQTHIVVTLQVEGFHKWPGAFEQVSFLRERHRHIFHIKCTKVVTDANREIEIICFKRKILGGLRLFWGSPMASDGNPCEFGEMSCEMIAARLLDAFQLSSCEVLEDGENGGLVIA
jgi:hypothetical protein